MGKTLTIALTTYNRPNFLHESIKSILNQTFKDFDLLILDNGSTNETSSVIDSFSDSRITCVKNHTNNLEFINKAFNYTKNDFLMIFHDDDIMEPNMIEEMIKIIKSDKEINTISCSINLINSNSKNLNKVRPRIIKDKVWKKKSFIKQYLFSGDIIPCPSTIFKSSLIKKHDLKYDWKVGPAVDLFLFFQINLLKGKMILLKKPLLNYRIHI
ncbi:MAG: glycosyltransferase, partial [Flavobacteriaceae bacterium]|nr:glycosyltransferase [Flavobacteriaceae bacterium]